MNKTVTEQVIKQLYPLVTIGAVPLRSLSEALGFSTPSSLRSKAQRVGATGQKDVGKALVKRLSSKGQCPDDYISECYQLALNTVKCSSTAPPARSGPPPKGSAIWIDNGVTYVETQLPGRTVIFTVDQHREMRLDYSEIGGLNLTQAEMAAKYGLSKKEFTKYKNIHGWVKSDDGFLDHDVLEFEPQELAQRLIERRATLHRTFIEEKLQRDRNDAERWRDLQAGIWDPFKLAVSNPSSYTPPKLKLKKKKNAPVRKLIINANDWQIGEVSQSSELMRGGDWSTEIAQNTITTYMEKIAEHVAWSGYSYDEVFICGLGDLGHGIEGFTAHGTKLEVDSIRQGQVSAILTGLRTLIDGARQFAPQVNVYHVEGNHLGFTSTLIFDQIAAWYGGANPAEGVKVVNNYKPIQYIPVGDQTLLVLFHGKPGGPSKGMSPGGPKRERDIYHLIMEGVRKYPNNRNVNLLTGHVHHRLLEEYSDVTVHTFGTIVAGDHYADQNLLTGCQTTQTIMDLDPETGLIVRVPIALR